MKIDDIDSTIYSHSLVLPQSSISKEPIFRIQVFMKLYSIHSNVTKMEIQLKVQCSVKAWGVSSFVEKFLMNQAQNTYTHWLQFVDQELQKKQSNIAPDIDIISDRKENIIQIKEEQDDKREEEEEEEENKDSMDIIDDAAIEIDVDENITANNVNLLRPVIGGVSRDNVVQKRNVSTISKDESPMSHSIELSSHHALIANNNNNNNNNDNIGNHIAMDIGNENEENEIHESRGINKKNASFRMKICRCGARICPSIFLREKKSNIHLMVDSRCQYLEKTLWFVILLCCLLIISLTIHRYQWQ